MKKTSVLSLIAFLLICSLCSCSFLMKDNVIKSLGLYRSGVEYFSDGYQDYIDFGVYEYLRIDLKDNKYFVPVTGEDIPMLLGYIENYESRAYSYSQSEKLLKVYCFDKEALNTEDWYFYIISKGEEIDGSDRRYDNYNLYLLNIEAKTLYYFHSNI